ncbi:hypothetical protein IQ251_03345 [Saccharopolyspora sp. HNM0983]|uniref:Uncharacterized protein n=1 Tax=Saccharopolyspora montiporae TaxID=2781240 RepID=A0A929FZ83_9PSEU|nr:hypothetical protein [Saccharopolyspora sp. HNM0983]
MAAEQTSEQQTAAPAKAVESAKAFVGEHGGAARAVVENLGRTGARLVLVGADGALGDVMVPSTAVGEAIVEVVDGLSPHDWDAETVADLKIGAAHRRKMAGPRAR